MQQFDFEKLDVYAVAMDFSVSAYALARHATRGEGYGDLGDQLRRAAASILSNVVEGAGEFSPREKARFYRLANRSATECAGLVELLLRLEVIDAAAAADARTSLLRIVSMLVKLVMQVESRDRRAAGRGYS